jgi:hypothetical protein
LPDDPPPAVEAKAAAIAPRPTASVSATISLDKEAEQVRLSVTEQIALQDAGLRQRDAALRELMVNHIVPAFLKANGVTLAVLGGLAVLDEVNLVAHLMQPGDRIINHQVIMALLGATTVQVGVIAAIIARYLFPGRSRDD